MYGQERRVYQRGSHFNIDARVSDDGQNWKEAHISDLSSGGLQLHTDSLLQKGDMLWFDLVIHGFFSEFEIKVKGIIRREIKGDSQHLYGVSFMDLSPDQKIRIDENVLNDRPVGGAPYMMD